MKRTGITLKYDDFTGEGYIIPSKVFKEGYLLLQIDCLKDWIYDLEVLYDKGVNNFKGGKNTYSTDLFKGEE